MDIKINGLKKLCNIFLIGIVMLALTGCGTNNLSKEEPNNTNDVNTNTNDNVIKEENVNENKVAFTEGTYIEIDPGTKGTEAEGYNLTITLENNKASYYNEYWEAHKTGTYKIEGNKITIHYTKSTGMTSFGEAYDDAIDEEYIGYIENNKIVFESMKGEIGVEEYKHTYELKEN